MNRRAALFAMMLIVCGCDAQADTPDAEIQRIEIESMTFGEGVTVIHDDRRDVTCWVYRTQYGGYGIVGGGISCIPDQMLSSKGAAQ